jgi:serine protease Do
MMKTFGKTLLAAILGSVVTLSAYEVFDQPEQTVVTKQPTYAAQVANYKAPEGAQVLADFTVAAEKVTPAVVHITTTMTARGMDQAPQAQIPDFFRDFFGDQFRMQPQEPRERKASGSGVIISEDGYIVTNNHVVDDASEILVVMNDNREYVGKVIGTDPSTDLALLKIDEKGLPALPMANSDEIKIGEWVLAVGNPFNLESTVTAGIVSAKGRSINILRENGAIESFIQTDAAINPGNSGGALVNLNGDLVGINTAIASPTGSYSGYGFAVPTNIMVKVVDDLMKYGKVQRAFLGIMIRNVNSTLADEKDLDVMSGVYVDSLMEGGAAKAAGIREGDVIQSVDGRSVKTVPQLQETIGRKRPGDKVEVVIDRKGTEKTLTVDLKNMEGNTEIVKASESARVNALGAEFSEIDAKAKEELGVDGGVQVTRLYPGKLRGQTNMREGFIITRIGDRKIHTVADLEKALADADGGILIEGYYPGDKQARYFGLGM